MALGADSIAIKKMRVCMGNQKTVCVTSPAGQSINDYAATDFSIFDAAGVEYIVWYNFDGNDTNPATGAQVCIEVAITQANTPEQAMALTAAAIDAVAGLCAFVSPADKLSVIYKVQEYASAADAVDGGPLGPTGYTFETLKDGYFEDLGATEGDLDISLNPTFLDITCHQTGTQLVGQNLTGIQPEISVTFKECRDGVFNRLINQALGGEATVDGSVITGFGTAKNGINVLSLTSRLILKPVENAEGDFTGSFAFLSALPLVDSILFSGENVSTITATFRAYVDQTAKANETDIVAKGNHFLI